jgi:hypothetical protein
MSKEEEKIEENNNPEETKEEKADNISEIEEKQEKYINPELLNDDLEESLRVEKIAQETKPYFSSNILPRSLYLQKTVLPLIYEALNQTEKTRPKDPIEFFAVYLLDRNKKEIQ